MAQLNDVNLAILIDLQLKLQMEKEPKKKLKPRKGVKK